MSPSFIHSLSFFFFQAEDGIRDIGVTGVQTCALPILNGIVRARRLSSRTMANIRQNLVFAFIYNVAGIPVAAGVLYPVFGLLLSPIKIGRASCRERV